MLTHYKRTANEFIKWRTGRSDLTRYELRQHRKHILPAILAFSAITLATTALIILLLMRH